MKNYLLLHTICWIIFILFELTSLQLMGYSPERPMVYIFFYGLNILFFYAHLPIFQLLFYRPGGWVKGMLLFMLLLIVYLLLKFLLSYLVEEPRPTFRAHVMQIKGFIYTAFYRGFYFSVLAVFYWSATHITGFRRDKALAEARLGKVRNALLQQQISPHVLFNTLNFIYSKVHNTSEEAARCVLLLADILRFSLEASATDEKIPLESELEHVRKLWKINCYRFGEERIRIEVNGETRKYDIIPLVLLTLTENVVKHADLSHMADISSIYVDISSSGLLTYNSRNPKKHSREKAASGKGLDNIRLRLEYAYPGQHQLTISETEHLFAVHLTVQL